MAETKDDGPSEPKIPAIGKRIVRWTRSRFGNRWARLAASLVVVVPLVWGNRESISKSLESLEKAHDAWAKNHPQAPKVNPGRFVVGVLVDQNGRPDDSVLRELKSEYWRDPDIEFARVDIPEIPDSPLDRTSFLNRETAISRWVRDSGAAGALWGSVETEKGNEVALLQWTDPDFVETDQSSFSRVIKKPTIIFPKIPISAFYGFARVWVVEKAKLHFEGSFGIHGHNMEWSDDDKRAFREVALHSCEPSTFTRDCERFADVQIELFLEDTWNEHLWTSEEDKNHLYACCYYSNSTGRDLTAGSPVVQSPDEFRHLFRQLDFIFAVAGRGEASDIDTDQLLCRAQIAIDIVQPDRVDVAARKEYPNFRNLLIITKALVDFTAIYSRIQTPVPVPEQPRPFEYSVCKQDPATWSQLDKSLKSFQVALDSEVRSGQDTDFQLGVWHSQLGTMYAKTALLKTTPATEQGRLWKNAREAVSRATGLLDGYKLRIPRYVTNVNLNLAAILQAAGGLDNAIQEQQATQKALTIAEQYDLSGLAHNASEEHSIAVGRAAGFDRDVDRLCRSVHEWFEADRFTRSTPGIQLTPSQNEDDFLGNMKLFRTIDQARYRECLRSAGADSNAVDESITELDSRPKA